ncbi:MAG: hypothetical protein EOP24_14250 [Hyphomicrobiales bacterium]|nr:MAG: hypothetical protein EOP24_14250 [Hyphomicrobiales bacterium]
MNGSNCLDSVPPVRAPSLPASGTLAIRRFLRPVSYQNMPAALLPPELQPGASSLPMMIDGVRSGSSPP